MNTTERRTEETLPLAELVGPRDQPPGPPIDLDKAGEQYLRDALQKTAIDRWHFYCPPKLKTTDWQNVDLAPFAAQHRAIIDWQGSGRGLLAAGPTGRGKSRAMWALMKRLSEDARDCRFFTAVSFFAALQAQTAYGKDTAFDWILCLSKCGILFIDDLGQEAVHANRLEWAQGWLLQLCDLRLGLGLPLFVTTNISAREMTDDAQEIRADPLIRRLLDLCDVVRF